MPRRSCGRSLADYIAKVPISANMVREMISEVIEFTRCYVVWRELVQPKNRPAREEHPDFLLTITNSLVQGFCVGTHQLFDRDTRTKSLPRLIEELRASHSSLVQGLQAAIQAQRPVLDKISRIHCNVYAHRNRSQDPQAVFKAAGLTPRQMNAIVLLAQEVVSALADATGVEKKDDVEAQFRSHETWVLNDTRQVVRALESPAEDVELGEDTARV